MRISLRYVEYESTVLAFTHTEHYSEEPTSIQIFGRFQTFTLTSSNAFSGIKNK